MLGTTNFTNLQVSDEGMNQREASTIDTFLFSIIFNCILSTYSYTYRLSVALSSHQRRSFLHLLRLSQKTTICSKMHEKCRDQLTTGFLTHLLYRHNTGT